MKKLLIPFAFLLAAIPANAGYKHELKTVVSGVTDGAYSHSKRIGSTTSFSSEGITASAIGGLTAPAESNGSHTGVAATLGTHTFAQTSAGASTSLTQSFLQGDVVPTQTGVGISNGATTTLLTLGDTVTYSGGNSTNMAVGLTQAGAISLTPGSAGSSVSGSISSIVEIGR